jgi:HAE1 family hydrophobic/amphiphilic exporter-1
VKLASVSIRRPVFALMLTLGLVTLGLVSLSRLEIALDPDVEFPFVAVTTVLRGASPETVESELTDVLEEEINTTEGIRSLRSVSAESLSQVFVEFEIGEDVDVKAQQVRDKVALARPRLPLDAEASVVAQLDPDAAPILSILLSGPLSIRELSELAENQVADRIERLPGVGSVSIAGSRRREIRIWVDPLRLTGYGLSIEEIADVLRRENAELAGGRIESARQEWAVTTANKVGRVEDFGTLIVAERSGSLVHLHDVATVEDGLQEERSIARVNGERGVSLDVRRRSGANTVAVARAGRPAVAAQRGALPRACRSRSRATTRRSSRTRSTRSSSTCLRRRADGRGRAALPAQPALDLIASLAIPSSVIASFTFFLMAGFTLNMMSLMALSLSIGLVIDDAIVVLEAIYRRLEGGEPRVEASDRGTEQVGLAVVSTTLAVCAVFVPIAFMSGMVGQWFYEFGLVVAIAVCVSTLVALTLTPMLASKL